MQFSISLQTQPPILDTISDWFRNLFNRPSITAAPTRPLEQKELNFLLDRYAPEEEKNTTIVAVADAIIQHKINTSMLDDMINSKNSSELLHSFVESVNKNTTQTDTTMEGSTDIPTGNSTTTLPVTAMENPIAIMAATNTTQTSPKNPRNSTLSYVELRRKDEMNYMIQNLDQLTEEERQFEKDTQMSSKEDDTLLTKFINNMDELFSTFWPYIPISVFLVIVTFAIIYCIWYRRRSKECDLNHDLVSGYNNVEFVIWH